MKKTSTLLLSFILSAALLSGCSESNAPSPTPTVTPTIAELPTTLIDSTLLPQIRDNIHRLDDTVLESIAQNYLLVFDFDNPFTENDLLDYGRVFPCIIYGGIYRLNPFNPWERSELLKYFDIETDAFLLPTEVVEELILEGNIDQSDIAGYIAVDGIYVFNSFFWDVRPELRQYFSKVTYEVTLPTKTVDEYILGKFNTVLDRSQIPKYVKYDILNDTYTFEPFIGSFNYNLSIDEQIIVNDTVVRFICTATLCEDVQDYQYPSYQIAFTIELINGEYRYLSVENLGNEKE